MIDPLGATRTNTKTFKAPKDERDSSLGPEFHPRPQNPSLQVKVRGMIGSRPLFPTMAGIARLECTKVNNASCCFCT
jgi:hypothetical protein